MKTVALTFIYSQQSKYKLSKLFDELFPEKGWNLNTVGNYVYHRVNASEIGGVNNALLYIGHTKNFAKRFREHNGIVNVNSKTCKRKQIEEELENYGKICLTLLINTEIPKEYYYKTEYLKPEKLSKLNELSALSNFKEKVEFEVAVLQSFYVEGVLLRATSVYLKNNNDFNYQRYLWNRNSGKLGSLEFIENKGKYIYDYQVQGIGTLLHILSRRGAVKNAISYVYAEEQWQSITSLDILQLI